MAAESMSGKECDAKTVPAAPAHEVLQERFDTLLELTYEMNNPLQVLMSLAEMDSNREAVRQVQRLMNVIVQMRATVSGQAVASRLDNPERVDVGASLKLPDRGRILVADDESMVRRVFSGALNKAFPHICVDEAPDGKVASDIFASKHPAIVIMDVVMPRMGGQEAFEAIRETCAERRWELPSFIFCTGYEAPPAIRALTAVGSLHSCLKKPFEITELIKTVSAILVERNAG
jgi:CheY-like chemotaxis protein